MINIKRVWPGFVPFVFIILFITLLFQGLWREPIFSTSGLVDHALPDFHLPDLMDPEMFYNKSQITGKISIMNVWATWCSPCAQEHPFLVQLAKSNDIPIYGLNYHDERENAIKWLQEKGNPYHAVLFDPNGQTGIDFGIIGVPETFIIDEHGVIRYRFQGILTEAVWQEKLLPMIESLKNGKNP